MTEMFPSRVVGSLQIACVMLLMVFRAVAAAELPPLDHQEVVDFQPAGDNLIVNGSFELGLGAEPFYPGWNMPTRGNLPTDAPQPPILDSPGANGSKFCLKVGDVTGGKHAFIDVSPPPVRSFTGAKHYVSVWARASCPRVELHISMENTEAGSFGSSHATIGPTWRQYVLEVTVNDKQAKGIGWVPHVRIESWTSDGSPFDVWYDDIQWSQSAAPKKTGRAPPPGPVDAVLLPAYRTGIYPANRPVELTWSAEAAPARKCQMEIHLLDVSRGPLVPGTDQAFTIPWRQTVALENHPSSGKIPLGTLKRGSYMALLAIRDGTSGELLGVARERFSVMADLRTRPAPIGFNAGTWGGLRGWGDDGPDYHWRGYWSTDEYYELCYQTGFRTQRLLANWESIEPVPGKRDWIFMTELEVAKKHDCETILCFPENWPRLLEKPKYQELLKDPDSSKGKWLYKLGQNIESELDGWPAWPDNRGKYVLIAPPVKELKALTAELAALVRGKVACLEVQNESNIILRPRALRDSLLRYMYPIMKTLAPDVNVLFNVTLDYQGDGNSFIDRYFAEELSSGQSFCDGFTFHPYERRDLQAGGLAMIRDYAKKLPSYSSRLKKALVYGQDEVDTQGSDWDYMQRFLIDWSGGCRWSAGQTLDLASFYEVGTKSSWRRRGTFVPGPPSVALNAMYDVLAGMRMTGQVDNGDRVLCALFESEDGGHYAAALCAADVPGHLALINAPGLSGLPVSGFDMWGEPMQLQKTLIVGREVIYLRSTDARLHDFLRTAMVSWHQTTAMVKQMNLDAKTKTVADFRQGGPETRYLLRNGLSRYLEQGVAWTEWSVKGSSDDSQTTPLEAGFATGAGTLAPESGFVVHSDKQPFIALANAGIPLNSGKDTWWLHGTFVARDNTVLRLNLSWSGADRVSVWVDGKLLAAIPNAFFGVMGEDWLPLPPKPIGQGLHNVILRLHRSSPILKVGVRTGCRPNLSRPVNRVQAPGVILGGAKISEKKSLERLVDLDAETKYESAADEAVVNVQFADGRGYALSGYRLTSARDHARPDPKRWTFEGSDEPNGVWVVLDRRDNESWDGNRKAQRTFRFPNEKKFSFYRLCVSNSAKSDAEKGMNGLQLAELELLDSSVLSPERPASDQEVEMSECGTVSGFTSSFQGGDYLLKELEACGFGNGSIELSLRIPPGFKATLFSDDGFFGQRTTFATGVHRLKGDAVKSMKVQLLEGCSNSNQ